jgi:DNA replication protein DnaC
MEEEVHKRAQQAKEAEKKREESRLLRLKEHPEEKLIKFGVPKKYLPCSFENFKNLGNLSKKYNNFQSGLVLFGITGCGKTHTAVAILRELVMRDSIEDACFVNISKLLLEIRQSFNSDDGKSEKDIVDYYSQIPFLILDDLGAEKTSEFAITTLYVIIDTRDSYLLPTIITTNLSLSQIEKKIGSRIASRLSGMQNVKINMPDYRKRKGA